MAGINKSQNYYDSDYLISGWYYDFQTNLVEDSGTNKDTTSNSSQPIGTGRMTCVSLHANRILVEKTTDGTTTVDWDEIPENDRDPDDDNVVDISDGGGTGNNSGTNTDTGTPASNGGGDNINEKNISPLSNKYSKKPLCVAVLNEDFSVSVANSWTDFGGDMIGEMWNSAKSLAPYVDQAQNAILSAAKSYRDLKSKADAGDQASINELSKVQGSTVSNFMANFMDNLATKIGSGQIDVADYLNRSLVMQGTRFSYYSGSGTSFSNLGMKFTIFPTWIGNQYITVNDKVGEIYPYVMGSYKSALEELNIDNDFLKSIDPSFIQWMCPPGGFRANVHYVDFVQPGTLKLKFGAFYSIPNLVCENATFTYSRQMVKMPADVERIDSNGTSLGKGKEIISPLYCDVTLQFRPCTKYSDQTLKKFVFGEGNRHTLMNVQDTLKKNLESEGTRLGNFYKESVT